MTDRERPTPPPDDLLVRYLDGEADPTEVSKVQASRGVGATGARIAELRHAGDLFSATAGVITVPEPPPLRRPWTFRPARAAAVALLLSASAAVAMPPVRGAISRTAAQALNWIRGTSSPVTPLEGPTGHTLVSIPVDGKDFRVTIDAVQRSGSLIIEAGSGDAVRASADGLDLLVLPGGLRIGNAVNDTQNVALTIPDGVRSLRITVGDVERTIDLRANILPLSISLNHPLTGGGRP